MVAIVADYKSGSVATVDRLTAGISVATVGRLTAGRRDATGGRLFSATSLVTTVNLRPKFVERMMPLQYRPPRKAG